MSSQEQLRQSAQDGTLDSAMRLSVLAFGWSACGMVGCSTPLQLHEPIQPPITLSGPTCPRDGPSVEARSAMLVSCGKGDTCTVLDYHVRNPTAQMLWLLLDGDEDFSRELEDVRLLQPWREPHVAVWEFAGRSVDLAVQVQPDADVVLRNLTYTRPLTEFRAVFLDRISAAQYRDIGILEPRGRIPTRGEVDLHGIGGFIGMYQSRSLCHFRPMELASISLRCVLTVPTPQG